MNPHAFSWIADDTSGCVKDLKRSFVDAVAFYPGMARDGAQEQISNIVSSIPEVIPEPHKSKLTKSNQEIERIWLKSYIDFEKQLGSSLKGVKGDMVDK